MAQINGSAENKDIHTTSVLLKTFSKATVTFELCKLGSNVENVSDAKQRTVP